MSKKQNEITWQRFKTALTGTKDMATNRGFRMVDGRMITYEQQKLGLSAYYDKRWVLEDGIHTEPIKFHCFTEPGLYHERWEDVDVDPDVLLAGMLEDGIHTEPSECYCFTETGLLPRKLGGC